MKPARFAFRGAPISVSDPWPPEGDVRLVHPLARHPGLLVQSWDGAALQVARLDALLDEGYRLRRPTGSDSLLLRELRAHEHGHHLLDHRVFLTHAGTPVILVHTYCDEADARPLLPAMCWAATLHFQRPITCEIDPKFNVYFPSRGCGFLIARPAHLRRRWSELC